MLTVITASLAAIVIMMASAWLLSLARRDASVVDIFWGLGFVLVAWVALLVGDGFTGRKILVTAMTTAWGLRLATYLFFRNRGKSEGFRYQRMREHYGRRFGLISLFVVFGLQGVVMMVVSLPVQVAQVAGPGHFTILDGVGAVAWLAGLLFEGLGDWQLARFKADPANAGKVMDRGLWAWTRHPNYFGDSLAWWGIFLVAAANPSHLWAAAGPLLMTYLLLRVSGVALLERSLVKRRPGYEDYVARTSAFIPWFPRKGATGQQR